MAKLFATLWHWDEGDNMRAVIYIRVSTKGQALEEKYSLRAQQTELTAYVQKMGWQLINTINDIDSGGNFEKQGLQTVMNLADEEKIDVVLVLDQSRLSRLDGLHWEMLKAVLKENNVKLAEPGSMIDLNDDIQEFMSDIQNWFARRGKKEVVKTMMRGKRQRLREGKPWGKVPYEYIYDKQTQTISVNDKFAWAIPMIDDLYLKQQLGLVTIAKRLNEISLTPAGKLWNERTVFHRIASKAYHGIMEKTFENGETISIPNIFPPLRTQETYNAIQEEKRKRTTQYKISSYTKQKYKKHIHFLRRTSITCGLCGYKIYLSQHGNRSKPSYYLKHGRKARLADQSVCDISINSVRFDENILNAIKDILTSEELAKQYIDLDNNEKDIDIVKANIKKIDKKIQKQHIKIERLMDLYLDDESFNKGMLDEKKKSIENELTMYQKRKNELNIKLKMLQKKEWNYSLIFQYMESARYFNEDLTNLERAQLVGTLFPTATLYESYIMLHGQHDTGLPIDVKVPINPNPYPTRGRHAKK